MEGADERFHKTLDQLHNLQTQTLEQSAELKRLREIADQALKLETLHQKLETAHRSSHAENSRLDMALRSTRDEAQKLADEVGRLQVLAHHYSMECNAVYEGLAAISDTCEELVGLVE